ncbi:MAG: DUF4142 domain-containing protein, partial [Proteobacteria bacterium]|nr:DUF4142 domain-containing protein [Pseudomonadota bacterium]
LDIIDSKLIPNAKRPEVADFLRKTSLTVARHLRMAEKLQDQVGSPH